MAPTFSTITLFAEMLISLIIYYSIYSGYTKNKFPTKLVGLALAYEIIFNITYMLSRAASQSKVVGNESHLVVIFAIVHGILSLIMFISLIVFFVAATLRYKKQRNYFREHQLLTGTFLVFWTFSVVSGIAFYFLEYIF